MAIKTGDMLPRASGSASIGVEQTSDAGGFTIDIRPYAHLHINSGVWHSNYGQSGIIRLGLDSDAKYAFESSLDGGITFGFLAQSGQIQESINQNITPHLLQSAYDGGNEIIHDFNSDGYQGVLVRETIPGIEPPAFRADSTIQPDIDTKHLTYGIAVSGFTFTPENVDSYGFTALTSEGLLVSSSGSSSSPGTTLWVGASQGIEKEIMIITTSGELYVRSTDDNVRLLSTGGQAIVSATAGSATLSAGGAGTANVQGPEVDITATAGAGAGITILSASDITLQSDSSAGQLRYEFPDPFESWHVSPSHTTDFFPIPHSGQVIQMILENAPGGTSSLQGAYDGGDEIDLTLDRGPIIKEQSSPSTLLPASTGDFIGEQSQHYAFAVSGVSIDPLNPNSFAFTKLTPNAITITASGEGSATADTARTLFLGYEPGDPDRAVVSTSGMMLIETIDPYGGSAATILMRGDGTITIDSDAGNVDVLADNDVRLFSNDKIDIFSAFSANKGDINLNAGQGVARGDVSIDAADNLLIDVFNSSGQLEYRFGPFEAWHVSHGYDTTGGPAGDGFHPLVPSGAIIQMILENAPGGGGSTLQEAYDAGNTIFVDGNGDLEIAAGDGKTVFGNNGTRAGIRVSGQFAVQTSDYEAGDLAFYNYSLLPGETTTASTAAEAAAKSLGVGELVVNTVSGIVNVRTGSGIADYIGHSSTPNLAGVGTEIDINWAGSYSDPHYVIDSASTRDIRILVPGHYKVYYKLNYSHTTGNTRSIIRGRAKRNGTVITRSTAFGYSRTNNGAQESTTQCMFLTNFNAGDILTISATTLDAASQTLIDPSTNLIIERIGPKVSRINDEGGP